MPDLFGFSGTDAIVLWVVVAAVVLGITIIVAMLAALLGEAKKSRQSVEYMRWVADGGPEREEAEKRASAVAAARQAAPAPAAPAAPAAPVAPAQTQFVPR